MKTWYCVTTSFDDRGRVTAGITDTKKASSQPEGTCCSTRSRDIYTDWFDSLEAAENFVEEARNA